MHPNDISVSVVRAQAALFLQNQYPSATLPIPIEEIAEQKLHIFIQLIPGIKDLLGIDAFINADFSQITIDESWYKTYAKRSRFSIAHEIGHMILHRDWYTNHGPQNMEEALSFQEKLDEHTYLRMENQANTFAGLILVPTETLFSKVEEIVGKGKKFPLIPPPSMRELITQFNVSEAVLLRRLLAEGILQDPSIPF